MAQGVAAGHGRRYEQSVCAGVPKGAKLSGARGAKVRRRTGMSPELPGTSGVDLPFFLRGGSARGPARGMERKRSWLTRKQARGVAAETAAPGDS